MVGIARQNSRIIGPASASGERGNKFIPGGDSIRDLRPVISRLVNLQWSDLRAKMVDNWVQPEYGEEDPNPILFRAATAFGIRDR